MNRTATIIFSSISTLLRPLVRILLRNNIPLRTFTDLAKRVYVDVALNEFALPGRKQSISRVALLTGLSRKEVLSVTRMPPPTDSLSMELHNRAARIISGWVRDPRFQDQAGQPAALPFDGETSSFTLLVREFSGDIPPRAVLDELSRVGLTTRNEDGSVNLLAPAFLPQTDADKLHILGSDVADQISTIDHNLTAPAEAAFFQRKVCYHYFPDDHLATLKQLTALKAQNLLEEMDRWLAEHDSQDPAPDDTGRHKRVGISIYYFEDEARETPHE